MEEPNAAYNFGPRGRGLFANRSINENELITSFPLGTSKDRQEGISPLVFDAYASPPIFFDSCVPLEADKLGYLINDGTISLEDYENFEEKLKSIATTVYQPMPYYGGLVPPFSPFFEFGQAASLISIKSLINCALNVYTGEVRAIKKIQKGNEILMSYGPEYWWTKIRSTFLYLGAYDAFLEFQKEMRLWWEGSIARRYANAKTSKNGDLKDDDLNIYVFERMIKVATRGDPPELVDGQPSQYRKNLLILSGMVFGTFENINGLIITVCPRDMDPNLYGPWSSTCPDDTDAWVSEFNKRVDQFFDSRGVQLIKFEKDGSLKRSKEVVNFLDELPNSSFAPGLVSSTPPWSCEVWIQDTGDRSYKCVWSRRKEKEIKIKH